MKDIQVPFLKGVLVAIFIMLLTSVIPILAVEYNAGVKAGDWVKYGEISVSWNGTGTEPQYISDAKQIDWIEYEVQSVSGTTVNINYTTHYKNGTSDIEGPFGIDIEGSSGIYWVIAGNLTKGDPVLTGSNALTLNDTVTRRYAGASRSVNYLNITYTSDSSTHIFRAYYDQATGMILEYYMRMPDSTTTGAFVEYSVKATETNMWSPDLTGVILGNPLYIVGIVVLVAIIVVGAFILIRRKPKPTTAEAPTPTAFEEAKPE